jgi:hypothetical protein
MPVQITYDKDGNKIPSKEFLNMLIILLRKCEMETGTSLVQYLEDIEENDPDKDIDAYDDKALRKAIQKYMFDNYPEMKPDNQR